MANSLSEACTPLKKEYDACFNNWFAGYLEPAVAKADTDRAAYSKAKADEYEASCGKIWQGYRECVHVRRPRLFLRLSADFLQSALKEKGLDTIVEQARQEHPLAVAEPPVQPKNPPSSSS